VGEAVDVLLLTACRFCATFGNRQKAANKNMKTILHLRPRNLRHRRARLLVMLGLQAVALWATTLLVLWTLASR
jgi:hypothetical protein